MPISRKSYKDFVFVDDNYSSSYVVVSVNINFDKPEIFFYTQILTVLMFLLFHLCS